MADYCTHTFRKVVSNYPWKNNSAITTYRMRCTSCGYRWTVYYNRSIKKEVVPEEMSDGRPLSQRRLTPEEVKHVLLSTDNDAELGRKLGVSHQSIHQIRTGRSYRNLWPELLRTPPGVRAPKREKKSRAQKEIYCESCTHWWQKKCGLELPEAGTDLAVDCSFYQVDD